MPNHSKDYFDTERNKDYKTNPIPSYYIGKRYKYEARKVVSDFELGFNCGNAITYLIRSNNKHSDPRECIQKAINHLKFELEELEYKLNTKDNV